MTNILDEIDIIKNIANIYDNNSSFSILKDMERVLDELDLYVYDNWKDGEIVSGPTISRHWVSIKVSWPRKSMPDPMGGKRLLDYDCQLTYQKSHLVKPKKIKKPSDIRPGTKKGILERLPIWIVEIKMPMCVRWNGIIISSGVYYNHTIVEYYMVNSFSVSGGIWYMVSS